MILRQWASYFKTVYGSELPDNYMVFDTETTGLSRDQDLPIEIGHVIVTNRQVTHRGSFVLNWADDKRVDPWWLAKRLHECQRSMESRGHAYRFTLDLLRKEGREPDKVLAFYHELFCRNREAGGFLVGQNAWFFDAVLLEGCFHQFLREDFHFGDNELFDAGSMEKACLLEVLPEAHETLKGYFLRLRDIWAKGVRWNLTDCLLRHGLDKRYNLDLSQAHNAGWDSYACHLLFEDHR